MTGYDGRGARFDIVAVPGNDLAFTVTAVDSDAAAIDLSAATIAATVYNGSGTAIDTMTSAVSGAGSNIITLSFTDAEVTALTNPERWALVVTRGGDSKTWLAGKFDVVDASRARSGTSGTSLTATVDSNVSVTTTITSIGGGASDITVTDAGGYYDASNVESALAETGVLPRAAFLTDVTITAIDNTTDPEPIDVINGVLYGRTVLPVTLWSSTDRGATWSSVENFGAVSSIISLHLLSDGEVLLNRRADGLYKSSGWATDPATATWSNVLTPTSGAWFLAWGVDADPTTGVVIAGEYAANPRDPSDGLWVSTDDGDTFTKVRSLNTEYAGSESTVHWHGVAIDRVNGRLWASHGDGSKQIAYSDDNGSNWTELSNTKQPTVIVGTVAGVVMGTDETPDGMMFVERTTLAANQTITQPFTARYYNTGGLIYQVQRGVRFGNRGAVLMAASAQSATTPGAIWYTPDGGRSGYELYLWELEGNVSHICVDGDGYVYALATSVDTTDYIIKGLLVESSAFIKPDPGGALGGTAAGTLGVAVGGGSTANDGGTSVGVGSTSENKGVAVGVDASSNEGVAVGSDSAAVAASATAVGRTAAVSGSVANATAIGYAAAASSNKTTAIGDASIASADRATALGRNAQAAYSDSVAIGADSVVTAAKQVKLDDRHVELTEITDAAAPAANAARLYVRDNGSGKTQLVVRFNSGAIQVIATEP